MTGLAMLAFVFGSIPAVTSNEVVGDFECIRSLVGNLRVVVVAVAKGCVLFNVDVQEERSIEVVSASPHFQHNRFA